MAVFDPVPCSLSNCALKKNIYIKCSFLRGAKIYTDISLTICSFGQLSSWDRLNEFVCPFKVFRDVQTFLIIGFIDLARRSKVPPTQTAWSCDLVDRVLNLFPLADE